MKNILRLLYQWLFFVPIFLVITIVTALIVMIMAPLFGSKTWGYYPAKWWSRLTCWLSLCKISTRGHENLDKNRSYVFVANHQGAFDIFLTYGFLNHNIVWMQKHSLRSLPLVGYASKMAGHVFVNNTNATTRAFTLKEAISKVKDGVSIVIFPEGARTHTGKMRQFKKGAFYIATEEKLPIVPITINGPFDVLKRGTLDLKPGKLELVIHKPIPTENICEDDIPELIDTTREIIYSALWEKYK
ncbi:MAG: 1-acyl-sn-glycerol-3-phosphate acyltransferase [Fermentimonas sp.]|nr:1-acyl-sn-glycerol-3-phosphate acyltransferase [Fermentimonas sp.]